GIGTNASSQVEKQNDIWYEQEWGRLLLEGGLILGTIMILTRIALFILIFYEGWRVRKQQPVALLIAAACGMTVLSGEYGQATIMGFGVFFAGTALAIARNADVLSRNTPAPVTLRRRRPLAEPVPQQQQSS